MSKSSFGIAAAILIFQFSLPCLAAPAAEDSAITLGPGSRRLIRLDFRTGGPAAGHDVRISRQPRHGFVSFPYGASTLSLDDLAEKQEEAVLLYTKLPAARSDVEFVWCKYHITDPDYRGADSFTWEVTGPQGESDTASVSITIGPNTKPRVFDSRLSAGAGSTIERKINFTDPDMGQPFTAEVTQKPSHGILSWSEEKVRRFEYSADTGYTGTDSFRFRIFDGYDWSDTGTITISIDGDAETLDVPAPGPRVLDIYVEPGLQTDIQSSLDQYTNDLAREGYTVSIEEFSGDAADLRTNLAARWQDAGLEGALLIGDLPYLEFTHGNDFGGGSPTFIHDMYLMDLDGEYHLDGSADHHYDGDGDVEPEIYVSRIKSSPLVSLTGKSEAQLINEYFERVHAYRTNHSAYADRGIVWADDDWHYWGGEQMGNLYDEVLAINDTSETTESSYTNTLTLNYQSILECIHSGATYHQVHHGGGYNNLYFNAIYGRQPRQAFYNMFNCSSGRFNTDNNLVCVYGIAGPHGINAVASSKTGSMLYFPDYYNPQAEGATLGEAFLEWFQKYSGETDQPEPDLGHVRWFYGMTMQGDPTLRPLGHSPELTLTGNADVDDSSGNNDGFANPGESVNLTITATNQGIVAAAGVNAVLTSTNALVTVTDTNAVIGYIPAGASTAASDPFGLAVSESAATPTQIVLTVTLTDTNGIEWTGSVPLDVYESSTINGSVTEACSGDPVSDASVQYTGTESGETLTDTNGHYSFTAVDMEYVVRALKEGYWPSAPQVIPSDHTGTVDFSLGTPDIGVSPASFTVAVPKADSGSFYLGVTNSGDSALSYSVFSDNTCKAYNGRTNANYWWYDITSTGAGLAGLAGDNELAGPVPLGFSFPFFEGSYTSLTVSGNGWVTFDEFVYTGSYNYSLPETSSYCPSNAIAFFWDDLDMSESGNAYYETRDDNMFILTFENVPIKSRGAEVTAQLILHSNGLITCQYKEVGYNSAMTVGYQDATKTRGANASYNSSGLTLEENMAIQLLPGNDADWLTALDPKDGDLAPAAAASNGVMASSYGLMVGSYTSTVGVVCNDPDQTLLQIPFIMEVTGNPTNTRPIAVNTNLTVNEDESYPGEAAPLPASDPDGDSLELEIVDPPQHGTLVNIGLSSTTYYPDRNYYGSDSFTYRVTDYEEYSNIATAEVVVAPVPDPVSACNMTAPADGASYNNNDTISLQAETDDADGAGNLLRATFRTEGGMILATNAADGDFLFDADTMLPAGTHGVYCVVDDADGYSATSAVVSLSVNGVPVAYSQSLQTGEGIPISITLDYADTDGPGPYNCSIVDAPDHGSLAGTDASREYTPDPGFCGSADSFTFCVHDGMGTSAPAEIEILVGQPNGTNYLPYSESFETYDPRMSFVGRNGWYSDIAANAVIVSNESVQPDYSGTYPLATSHTQVAELDSSVTNLLSTANLTTRNVVTELLFRPRRYESESLPEATGRQVALLVNSNGILAARLKPDPASDPVWWTLTNAPAIPTSTWVKVTIRQLYSETNNYYSVALDDQPPVSDQTVGYTNRAAPGNIWFLMADQSRNYMSSLGFRGEYHVDDVKARLWTTNDLLNWLVSNYPGHADYDSAAYEDTDLDGMVAQDEWKAGTDPHDPDSILAFSSISTTGSRDAVLTWQGVTGKLYRIEAGTNLVEGFTHVVTNHVPGTELNTCTIRLDNADHVFYRIVVSP